MKTLTNFLAIIFIAGSASLAGASNPKSPLSHFLVIAPHTSESCANILSEMKGKSDAYLSKFYFGCNSGDHTAYAIIDAASEDAVKKMLPADMQKSAKIEKIDRFTAAQLEGMHKEKK